MISKKLWPVAVVSALVIILGVIFAAELLELGRQGVAILVNEPEPTATSSLPSPTYEPGTIRISYKDGMTMVYVPAGHFVMGSSGGAPDERPEHEVYLSAFWIDRTEVTNGMYNRCVSAGVCTPPAYTERSNVPIGADIEPPSDHPVVYVDWEQAQDYCAWVERRLPTEAEWEKAGRGTEGQPHPWGLTDPDESLLNFDENVGETTAVGSYPAGASPYGALDIAGNVIEWVADCYNSSYYRYAERENPAGPPSCPQGNRVIRGGSSWDRRAFVPISVSDRHHAPADEFSAGVGFRCAMPE